MSQASSSTDSRVELSSQPLTDDAQDSAATDADPVAPASVTDPVTLAAGVEAALISTDKPLTSARIADLIGGAGAKDVAAAVESLNEQYQQTGRSFTIEQVAGGWQIMTRPDHAAMLQRLHKTRMSTKLTSAAMETLSIIAYRQPVLRADIEAVRGVASGEMVRSLMDRRLVKIVGRAEEIGRPMLYGTTRSFLEVFGLSSLKDLPKVEELRKR